MGKQQNGMMRKKDHNSYSMVVSTFPLTANNRYIPSLSSLLSSHLGRHLLDSYINLPMYLYLFS